MNKPAHNTFSFLGDTNYSVFEKFSRNYKYVDHMFLFGIENLDVFADFNYDEKMKRELAW